MRSDDRAGSLISGMIGIILMIVVVLVVASFLEWTFGFHFFEDPYYWFYHPRGANEWIIANY